jgi:hypothetical protein
MHHPFALDIFYRCLRKLRILRISEDTQSPASKLGFPEFECNLCDFMTKTYRAVLLVDKGLDD